MRDKKLSKWASLTLLGLTLAGWVSMQTSAFAQGIAGTNEVGRTDFDSASAWSYGYFYSWGWPASGQFTNGTWANNYSFTDPIKTEGPIVGAYFFTNTGMADLMTNSVNGTYSDVSGATSPYVIPIASAPRFFRTQWVPPP